MAYAFQLLYGLAFSIALGPLFDVYLFQLGGGEHSGNKIVGTVESVSGLVALGLALPVGVIVDTWNRVRLMRIAAVVGLLSSAMGCYAIASSSINAWYVTMVLTGVYAELGNSVCYALFADSLRSEDRQRATENMGMISNISMSVGPALTLVATVFIGDRWSQGNLEKVLMAGMAVLNPLACMSMFLFTKAPFEQTGDEGEDEADSSPADGAAGAPRRGAKAVPYIIAFSDLLTCIGAGMTIKYFNLYWKNDWSMSPAQVLAISAVQPLSVAAFIKILQKPSQMCGRAQASLFQRRSCVRGACGGEEPAFALVAYFIRSGMANAVYPLNKSIMFDFTPSNQRGRWNAIETLSGSVWSGSAFIGGIMADRYDYRFTFLVTAGIYLVGCGAYAPLLCIVPRRQPAGTADSKKPLLASPGRFQASPGRGGPFASPGLYVSPAARMNMGYQPMALTQDGGTNVVMNISEDAS
eukprot:CAMPEP_0117500616 /NCGR_PEP_ID=MMETSP0784-20121206/22866_1 /TAXON_ID=39447 /ORGANISM="" /LENGTH=467 /DNA_ID=CAMNT_0005295827 /DNA_START=28 /DNA_END=1432 /DNA_ORIENTATION=-